MGKQSQIEKVLAALEAERDVLDHVIEKIAALLAALEAERDVLDHVIEKIAAQLSSKPARRMAPKPRVVTGTSLPKESA